MGQAWNLKKVSGMGNLWWAYLLEYSFRLCSLSYAGEVGGGEFIFSECKFIVQLTVMMKSRLNVGYMKKNDDSTFEEEAKLKYKRVVLKISGEMLRGDQSSEAIDGEALLKISKQIKSIYDMGVQVAVVVGGGNIFRGLSGVESKGVDRTTGDYMGMLSTVINGMALMDCLEKMGVSVRVQTAVRMESLAEPFILRRAVRHLEKGRLVIFVAGTGNPYFSTDTAAALRASEIQADVILKATKVDGVYDKDPMKHKDAKKYEKITFMDALRERLKVMDTTAFSLCMDNQLPIFVFNLNEHNSIQRAVCGDEHFGTLVY